MKNTVNISASQQMKLRPWQIITDSMKKYRSSGNGMMLGLAAGMSTRYYIYSNREPGEGRVDLVLEPKVALLPGIIMEFKASKEDTGLLTLAEDALRQIDDKNYDTDMQHRGVHEIVKYGIAFAGKKVEIAT